MNILRMSRTAAVALTAGLFFGMSNLAGAAPDKWEYLVVTGALKMRNLEQMLNARGAEGWELVTFTRNDVAVFKRETR